MGFKMLKFSPKPTGEKLTPGESRIVIALEKKNRKTYSEIARITGLSVQGTKNIIRKLKDEGIVKENPNSPNGRYILNRKTVYIKRFSTDLFKQLMLPVVIGMFLTIFLAFFFKENAFIFAMGGTIVFFPQLLYTLYKILGTEDIIEVFKISTSLKKVKKRLNSF